MGVVDHHQPVAAPVEVEPTGHELGWDAEVAQPGRDLCLTEAQGARSGGGCQRIGHVVPGEAAQGRRDLRGRHDLAASPSGQLDDPARVMDEGAAAARDMATQPRSPVALAEQHHFRLHASADRGDKGVVGV